MLMVFFSFNMQAQSGFEYVVTVVGKGHSKLSNVKAWLLDDNTGHRIEKFTNSQSKATFNPTAGAWSVNLQGLSR